MIDFTEKELRALQVCLFNSFRMCNSTCIYPEYETKKTHCENCEFTKSVESVSKKIVRYNKQKE